MNLRTLGRKNENRKNQNIGKYNTLFFSSLLLSLLQASGTNRQCSLWASGLENLVLCCCYSCHHHSRQQIRLPSRPGAELGLYGWAPLATNVLRMPAGPHWGSRNQDSALGLCWTSPFPVLWLEKAGFPWTCLLLLFKPVVSPWVTGLISTGLEAIQKVEKTQGLHHVVSPVIWFGVSLLLSSFQSFCLLIISRVLVIFQSGKAGKSKSVPSCPRSCH